MKYRDYSTRAMAIRRSQDMLKALHPSAYVEGKGLPPGNIHGTGILAEGQGWTTMLTGVVEGAKRLDGRFLLRDDTGTEVAEDEIKRPQIDDDVEAGVR